MGVGIVDAIFLLLTAVVAIYLIYRFFQYKPAGYLWYSLSFVVLVVAGVLILFGGFAALQANWVKVVATLIPFGIAIGLMVQYYPKLKTWWMIILGIGFILIALNVYGVVGGKIWYPIFHSFAGLTIFFVPIFVVSKKQAPGALLWVTVGGALIGLGGMGLAMGLADLVLKILTPVLFLMTLSYTWGFVRTMMLTKND